MKHIFQQVYNASVLFLAMLIALSSCKKADTVGLEVLPDEDRLLGEFTDTVTVWAHTVREDSLLTSGTTMHILGSHNDPIFGLTTASIYSQFVPEAFGVDFGTNPTVDSIVLSLGYAGYYADIMKLAGEQSFSVHRVTEDLPDSIYSNETYTYLKFPLGMYSGLIDTRDSVRINGSNEPPQMRIKLNNSFGTDLINAQSFMDSDTNFLEQFKGLYITPITQNLLTGMGTLIYISPSSAYTKLTLYYKNDTEDSLSFSFKIKTGTNRFGSFQHDYSSAVEITNQLADSTLGADKLYLQSMAGLKAKITFPHLNNLVANGRKIVVNKAELVFPITAGTTSRLSAPSKLIVVKKGSDGKDKILDDMLYESADFFNGYYNSSEQQYAFNFPRHMQSLLNDTAADKTLYLRVTGSAASGNRCVINGTSNTDKPLKLRLTYTILE